MEMEGVHGEVEGVGGATRWSSTCFRATEASSGV